MKRKMDTIRCDGFTVLELLTTITVIGVLLALLIPALNQVSKTAMSVKQKAQFHAIGTALEAFRNDYGDYPPSQWDVPTYGYYSASQRLAEALLGQDGFGFHESSRFRADGTIDGTAATALYYPNFAPADDTERDANLAERKGPYLELENANAVKLSSIYNPMQANFPDTFILADMYKQIKHQITKKQTGMPILYYKANRLRMGNDPGDYQVVGGVGHWPNNTYNLGDSLCGNLGLIQHPSPSGERHFGGDLPRNCPIFYNAIANPNFPGDRFTTVGARPHRTESFILHSAGPDAIYGTPDDVFNFEAEK